MYLNHFTPSETFSNCQSSIPGKESPVRPRVNQLAAITQCQFDELLVEVAVTSWSLMRFGMDVSPLTIRYILRC